MAVIGLVIFPMPKRIFFSKFLEENSQFQIRKNTIFIMAKVGFKLSNIQHCTVSYNTSCNGDYMLTLQLNSDLYLMYFFDLTIKLKVQKIPNFWHFRAKIPNSRGNGHRPKIVKKALNFIPFTP